MRLALIIAASFVLIACQSVTPSRSNTAHVPAQSESVLVSSSSQDQVLTNQSDLIVARPLKKAVDVAQIDSLMDSEIENTGSLAQDSVKLSSESLKAANLDQEAGEKNKPTNDPITLNLLDRGALALAQQRLLTPEEDNANLYFQAALGREPNNVAAQAGINEIVHFYTTWALDKTMQGQQTSANHYLNSARFVDAAHPDIKKTEQAIKDWRAGIRPKLEQKTPSAPSQQNRFYLPENLFSLPDALVIKKLQPIIDRITKDQLNIDIFWPNDKEARLLYQIINSRTETFRVRGMIYRRAQHMIEVKQG